MAEVAVDPRRGVEVVVQLEPARVLHFAVLAVPYSRFELRGVEVGLHQVLHEEVPVAARQHVVHLARGHRLLGQCRHVVAHEDVFGAWCLVPGAWCCVIADPLPVALDHGRLGFEDHQVWLRFRKTPLELLGRPLLCDAVQPYDIVPRLLHHGGRRSGHHWEDVGGAREPLELPVLGKERNSLLRRQRRIGESDYHL